MADHAHETPQKLFDLWRRGDAAAGQAMAQRFSDWYYAVTAARLGDTHGRGPLQRACVRFEQGIAAVQRPDDLAQWAHQIIAEEMRVAGGRIAGGDFANQLTRGRSPTEILQAARASLPPAEVALLAHTYDSTYPMTTLTREAEALGGWPFAVLQARYRVKRELARAHGVAFSETPESPNLDYAPLPLYEAGRMQTAAEEAGFEKWLLTNMGLCKDIAEFGVFALALRGGAFAGPAFASAATVIPASPEAPPSPAPVAEPPAAATEPGPMAADDPFSEPAEPPRRSSTLVWILGGVALLAVFLVVAAVGLVMAGFLG